MSTGLKWFTSSHSGTEGGNCVEVALEWSKSSYSDDQGGNCIEVAASWSKSSYSNTEGGDCIEVATCPHTVHVRDSKLGARGPRFAVAAGAWEGFVAYAKGD